MLVALGLAGCAGDPIHAVLSPATLFYTPTHLQVTPDGKDLLVVSSNSDKRYATGWLSAVHLDDVDALRVSGTIDGATVAAAAARRLLLLPALAGPPALTTDGSRAFVAFRGESEIAAITLSRDSTGHLQANCGDSNDKTNLNRRQLQTDCDAAHLLSPRMWTQLNMPSLAVDDFDDPYAAVVLQERPASGTTPAAVWVAVGYKSTPRLTFAESTGQVPLRILGHTQNDFARLWDLRQVQVQRSPLTLPTPTFDTRFYGLGYDQTTASATGIGARVVTFAPLAPNASLATAQALEPEAVLSLSDTGTGGDAVALAHDEETGRTLFVATENPDAVVILRPARAIEPDGTDSVDPAALKVVGTVPLTGGRPAGIAWIKTRGGGPLLAVSLRDGNGGHGALAVFAPQNGGETLVWVRTLPLPLTAVPTGVAALHTAHADWLAVALHGAHAVQLWDVTDGRDSAFFSYTLPGGPNG